MPITIFLFVYLSIYLFTHSFILIFISTASAPHWGLQHPNPLLSPRILHRCLTAVRWETHRERPYRLHRLFLGTHHCHKACASLADLVFLIAPPTDSYLVSQRNLTLLASCETDTYHEHTDLFVTQFASKISVIPWPSHLRCKIGMNNRTHPPGF